MALRPRGSKCASACNNCRVKKAKCTGTLPCKYCVDRNEHCWFPESPQGTQKRKRKHSDRELEERFARLEALVHASKSPRISETAPLLPPSKEDALFQQRTSAASPPIAPPDAVDFGTVAQRDIRTQTHASVQVTEENCDSTYAFDCLRPNSSHSHVDQSLPSLSSTRESEQSTTDPGIEYVSEYDGRNSYLSICAEPGMSWVARRLGSLDFNTMAQQLTTEIWGNRRRHILEQSRMPEPSFETAWEYTQSYFNHGLDIAFGYIDRALFERRLRAHFDRQNPKLSDDRTWYALRNTIYAYGCRGMMKDQGHPTTFTDARDRSWPYFENALSVHADLIFAQGGINAIQALVVMAGYSEAHGNLALEYMLVSSAVRLAQSKGLHLEADKSWKLSDAAIAMRYRLWWNIYLFDKNLALRSGRPSAIDDTDITCPIPATPIPGHTAILDFHSLVVQHSRIISLVLKKLSADKLRRKSSSKVLATIKDLDRELHDWYESVPAVYKSVTSPETASLPPHIGLAHLRYIHANYNCCLIMIHAPATLPWNRLGLAASSNAELMEQKRISTEVVAAAARNIIVTLQGQNISTNTGVCLTTFFPLVALIHLFLHVIQHPNCSTTASDLSLLEAAAGHFGYLNFISGSEVGTKFPRQIVSYASEVTERGNRDPLGSSPTDAELAGLSKPFEFDLDFLLSEPMSTKGSGYDFDGEDWSSILLDPE